MRIKKEKLVKTKFKKMHDKIPWQCYIIIIIIIIIVYQNYKIKQTSKVNKKKKWYKTKANMTNTHTPKNP